MKFKKNNKNLLIIIICVVSALIISIGLNSENSKSDNTTVTDVVVEKEIKPGEVFEKGSYITIEDIKIAYTGEEFVIDNQSEDIIIITCGFYGKKSDNTYEFIGMPAFYGIDNKQYEQDKEKNGWAIEKTTNKVRPKETLVATLHVVDMGANSPAWDIDGDGYYDISFSISTQENGSGTTISINDKKSDYYKLKVD